MLYLFLSSSFGRTTKKRYRLKGDGVVRSEKTKMAMEMEMETRIETSGKMDY